jgi:hypothetical protein
MEKLSKEQRKLLKKTKTTKSTAKLLPAGISVEQIKEMDREALMEACAHVAADEREESEVISASPIAVGYDIRLARERLAFEMRQFQAEERGLGK